MPIKHKRLRTYLVDG